jgi:DnaK suppressor protein
MTGGGLRHHADLNRSLVETEARLKALDAFSPDHHGDDADQRTARQNLEDVVTERARLETHRRFLLSALTKIERGVYGTCESCRNPIGGKRLDVMPEAVLCLRCQTASEVRMAQVRQAIRPVPDEDDERGGEA